MAATSLLLVEKNGKIADLVLDCVLSESHKYEMEVTSHNVEEGSDITDHAREKPREVTITGLVSETPVTLGQKRRLLESKGASIETGVSSVFRGGGVSFATTSSVPSQRGSLQYVEAALAKLDNLFKAKQLVSLVTSIRKYDNMMITSLTIPRDPKTGEALNFTAVFRAIRFASLRTTQAQTNKVASSNKKVDKGKQVGKPEEPKKNQSAAKFLKDAVGNGIDLIKGLRGGVPGAP